MAERHRLQEQLRCATEQSLRTASSLQQRITILQQECEVSKVRAHARTHTHNYIVCARIVLMPDNPSSVLSSECTFSPSLLHPPPVLVFLFLFPPFPRAPPPRTSYYLAISSVNLHHYFKIIMQTGLFLTFHFIYIKDSYI